MNTGLKRIGNSLCFKSHDPAEAPLPKFHHKKKKHKHHQHPSKSKAERQAWWRNLSQEDKNAYLERVQARKAEKRQKQSIERMAGKHFDCTACIHGLTKSCTDKPPDGCVYFYNANTNAHGPAYNFS